MSLPAIMDSEDAPHPESHKLECTRRDDKIRLIAVTLPSLNGMAENLMDPPTVFAQDAETLLPFIDQMCTELAENTQRMYQIYHPESLRPTKGEYELDEYRGWLRDKVYFYLREGIKTRPTEPDVVAAFKKLKRHINRFDKSVSHAICKGQWF